MIKQINMAIVNQPNNYSSLRSEIKTLVKSEFENSVKSVYSEEE